MQRVSALLWERTKSSDSAGSIATGSNRNSASSSKNGRSVNKVFSWGDRASASKTLSVSPAAANALYNGVSPSMGREAYWPTTLDRECDKAARILKSFSTDGFLDEAADTAPTSPTNRSSITSLTSARLSSRRSGDTLASPTTSIPAQKKKIPPLIIQDAVGLAIFSCMRSGLWMSGSGGSGILIARKADGTWSPPSGILLHTATLAFVMGVDIYDCVLVINSVAALEMFTHPRVTLGADVPLAVGPLVPIGLLENDFRWNNDMVNTVLTYVKARGIYRPAQLYGSLVAERANENERFYSDDNSSGGTQPIDILDILAGNIRKSVPEILPLFEAIKAAEGRIDYDSATMERLSQQPAPGDADIADTPGLLTPASPLSTKFGVPDAADPDPFGIIALEMAGLEIREAGSKHRPASNQFDYNNASPTSPVFASHFHRQSADATLEHGNRTSYMSTRTQATSMTDACTQTDVAETPDTSLSPSHSDDGKDIQAAADPKSIASPVSDISLPAAPTGQDHASVDTSDLDRVDYVPTRHAYEAADAAEHTDTTESTQSKYLMADRAMASEEQSDADTAASSHHIDDERDEDADDEDEVTADDLSDDLGDDLGDDDDVIGDEDVDDDEEPVIFEVATTATQPVRAVPTQVAQVIQAKGALVTIPKRVPPPLPLRSPARRSRASKSEYGDLSMVKSPLRQSFQSAEVAASTADGPAEVEEAKPFRNSAVQIIVNSPLVEQGTAVDGFAEAPPVPSPRVSAVYDPIDVAAASKTDAPASQATGPTMSSADESDRELRTPRPEDELDNNQHRAVAENGSSETPEAGKQQDPNMGVGHANPSSVTVA